ncbi:hypothetical protein HDU98_003132 [Podochytrium sp. JEL0797]|nr:hypothetical protein HDU98_003132 [Podochytrium sp. JEL0797]
MKEQEWHNASRGSNPDNSNANSILLASLGMMETRGLGDRLAGMERFVKSEMERMKDSIGKFEALVREESMRREHLQTDHASLHSTVNTLTHQLTTSSTHLQSLIHQHSHPQPPSPTPPPPPQHQQLTPTDILSLLHPFLSRLESTTNTLHALETRLTQLETASTASAAETRVVLHTLAAQIQDLGLQHAATRDGQVHQYQSQFRSVEDHVRELVDAKVREAVATVRQEVSEAKETWMRGVEAGKSQSEGIVAVLEKRVDGMEVDARERREAGERDLRALLEGVVGVKQAMMQLGKGSAEKRVHDEYLAELKVVKEELMAEVRETREEFRKRVVAMAVCSSTYSS